MRILGYYMLLMSLLLFAAMGIDKWSAIKQRWRIPETTLFLLAVIGGAPGGLLGMMCFRHKIRKPLFSIGFPALSILWVGAAIWFSMMAK